MTGPLLMIASAASWAAGLILTKATLDHTGAAPSSLLLVQLGASVGVLALASLFTGTWPRRVWRRGWVGLLEPGIAYQFALAGLALTSATNASVLGSLEPVMVPLIAWLLLRERPRAQLIVLVAGATIGSVLVSMSSGGDDGSLTGDALIVASVAAAALYVVVASRQVAEVRPLPAALTQQTWALGLTVLVCVSLSGGAFWPDLTPSGLLLGAVSGIVNYALPFWLYLSALTRMPVSRAATYLTLIPVFGVLGSVVVLGDGIGWLDVIGSALVVACLLLDSLRNRPDVEPEESPATAPSQSDRDLLPLRSPD
jgi:drug/metabolite transporter (DMT)-like permease